MGNEHPHHHHVEPEVNKAFFRAIILNIAFVLIEAVFGFLNNSVGLLSDAGHNLGDVISLALSAFAVKMSQLRPTKKYTYGYRKTTVLVSLVNAIILLVTVGFIISESIRKIYEPQILNGLNVVIVAAIGVVINSFTAWLFIRHQNKDLNIKGAYLHLAADALVSIGVVVAGIVIMISGWYIVDALIGLVIALVILYSTWNLLIESIKLSLDAVPKDISIDKVSSMLMKVEGVQGIHHIHIWALSTNETALTAHICVEDFSNMEQIKHDIKHILNDLEIHHSTLEFEITTLQCEDNGC
ncbi:MAG: cation diffusion facilitator family transporter [Bacteroidales bacterium]|jgi:cobalt-zinc-cadmium efflux system protein|nr:cation diffusion facilitator family transporter [Bacteroidales bacterium]